MLPDAPCPPPSTVKELFFVHDPEEGFYTYTTEEDARVAAHNTMVEYHTAALHSGWPEYMEDMYWGRLVVMEQAKVGKIYTREELGFEDDDSGLFDAYTDYKLVPVTTDLDVEIAS